jgi:hypothetical protein
MMSWLSGLLLIACCTTAFAQKMGYGEAEYLNSCAVCHGKEAHGDGPLAEILIKQPTDLTKLSANNKGVFPYWRVFSSIDGRFVVRGHGDREMPVWGRAFYANDQKKLGPIGGEAIAEERIHALTEYIQTLQR